MTTTWADSGYLHPMPLSRSHAMSDGVETSSWPTMLRSVIEMFRTSAVEPSRHSSSSSPSFVPQASGSSRVRNSSPMARR